jgi:hypothetical protein
MTTFRPHVPIDHPRPFETPSPELAVHIDEHYMHLMCYNLQLPQPTARVCPGQIDPARLRATIDAQPRLPLSTRLRLRRNQVRDLLLTPPEPTREQAAALAHAAYLAAKTTELHTLARGCAEHGHSIIWS